MNKNAIFYAYKDFCHIIFILKIKDKLTNFWVLMEFWRTLIKLAYMFNKELVFEVYIMSKKRLESVFFVYNKNPYILIYTGLMKCF